MSYSRKIILNCPTGYSERLVTLVEEFVRDDVVFVGVVGYDCVRIEDIIDELVVGNGDREYDLLTSSHPNQSLEQAIEFADSLTGECEGPAQVVEL